MKKTITLILTAIILFSFPLAVSANEPTIAAELLTEENNEVMSVEITEWRYRTVNGVMEMRLWSVSYGIWKTDWIPVG